ncbi:hypothetical protein EXIGLDRAFT_717291, partial [Exidia glandulosa HHB12029]
MVKSPSYGWAPQLNATTRRNATRRGATPRVVFLAVVELLAEALLKVLRRLELGLTELSWPRRQRASCGVPFTCASKRVASCHLASAIVACCRPLSPNVYNCYK